MAMPVVRPAAMQDIPALEELAANTPGVHTLLARYSELFCGDAQALANLRTLLAVIEEQEPSPSRAFKRLRKAWVCGQQLSISVDSGGGHASKRRPPPGLRAKRKHHDHKQQERK